MSISLSRVSIPDKFISYLFSKEMSTFIIWGGRSKLITYSFEPNDYWNNLSELKHKYSNSNIDTNGHLFLIEDNWNDYWKYHTSFNAIINKDDNFLFLGKIKIMKCDVPDDEMYTFTYLKTG